MGFRAAEDWAERTTYSLVSNFFCAVHREEMVLEVDDDRTNSNRYTLESFFSRQDIIDAAERTGHQADLTFAAKLYRCLVSDSAEERILTIPKLGQTRIRVLIEKGMPCRVGFIRNGMLITDNLRHFGHGPGFRTATPCSGNPFARSPARRELPVPRERWRQKASPSQVLRISRTSTFAWEPEGGLCRQAKPFLILAPHGIN
jgi:hypothetical protein